MPRQPTPEGGIPTMDQGEKRIEGENRPMMKVPLNGTIRIQRDYHHDSGSVRSGSEATEWCITLNNAGECISAEKYQRSADDNYLHAIGSNIGRNVDVVEPKDVPVDIIEEARAKSAEYNEMEMRRLFYREPYRIKTKSALHKAILRLGGCRNENKWSDPREWENSEFIDMIKLNNGLDSNEDITNMGDDRSPDKKQLDALIEKYQK